MTEFMFNVFISLHGKKKSGKFGLVSHLKFFKFTKPWNENFQEPVWEGNILIYYTQWFLIHSSQALWPWYRGTKSQLPRGKRWSTERNKKHTVGMSKQANSVKSFNVKILCGKSVQNEREFFCPILALNNNRTVSCGVSVKKKVKLSC